MNGNPKNLAKQVFTATLLTLLSVVLIGQSSLPASSSQITRLDLQDSSIKVVPNLPQGKAQRKVDSDRTQQSLSGPEKSREQIYYQQGSVAQGQLAQLLYRTPSFYPCGYVYTAELRPLSGDPDLYLHERVSGTWRKLKESLQGSGVTDSFTFTCGDITASATNVDLDVKGYTAAGYEFFLFREAGGGGGNRFMEFPLHNGDTPYTAKINAIVDHSMTTGGNCPDYVIVSYTNERGDDQYGLSVFSTPNECGSADRLYGFKNASGSRFSLNGQYNTNPGTTSPGNEGGYYLFYDGHTGFDYPAPDGTAVYPVAPGTAYTHSGNDVLVQHANGYTSYYLHLSSKNISEGQSVTTSTRLGGVGQGHLHLTVKKGTQRVDPYGWEGPAGQDPLKVNGGDNICLWKACN